MVNNNKYNPHFKSTVIFKSLKESQDHKVCEGLLYDIVQSSLQTCFFSFPVYCRGVVVFKEL